MEKAWEDIQRISYENLHLNPNQKIARMEYKSQTLKLLKVIIKLQFNYIFILIMTENSQKQSAFMKDFLSGGVAGIISKTVVAPIQRVKLLMQTQKENSKVTRPYKGTIDCFMRCLREEGVIALWRGNWVNVVRYFPTQALGFSFKEHFNNMFGDANVNKQDKMRYLYVRILSGGLAGAATTVFVHPLDFARTRLGVDLGKSVSERQFTGLMDCLRKTYSNEGIRGLYRGFVVSIPSIFIYRGLYFGIYDFVRDVHLEKNAGFMIKFAYAQVAVMLSELISYPGDTVKRKMMMQSLKAVKEYSGVLDCFAKIYKAQGLVGYWSGAYTNALRSIGSSLCLVLYDEFTKISGKF